MRSVIFVVASLALLAACVCAPEGESIQRIPTKAAATPSATDKDAAKSGASVGGSGASEPSTVARERRDIAGQESDLLPSAHDLDASPFGEISKLDGRGRIKVLPAFLG